MTVKVPITGAKYVEYAAEDKVGTGTWGVLIPPDTPEKFLWLGLVNEFIPPHKELYEEHKYLGASGEEHSLELKRNISVGTELTATLKYAMQDWTFLNYITGAATGFDDAVDSVSVIAYIDSMWTVLTGGMLTKWALSIPESGIATVDVDLMFADVVGPSAVDPNTGTGAHADELTDPPYVWKDITLLKMGAAGSEASLVDIVGGLTMTITSEVEMSKGVDSEYATKGSGVTVNCRDIEVSLDLTYTDLTTIRALVTGHTKQSLTFTLGGKVITVGGLLFDEWVAELKPCELVGQTITAKTDLASLVIADA